MHMDHFPPLWTKSAEAVGLWQRLRSAPRSLLMLDYDGTLAPFHEDRFKALAYAGVEDRLAILSGLAQIHLVLVTGRPARELRALLPASTRIDIWGSHGREQLKSDGAYKLFALDSVQQATLQHVAREMAALGFPETLELKPSSLAVHWRSCEPEVQEQIRSRIQSVFDGLDEPGRLHLLPFDGGLELRSNDRTKGTAVRQIMALEPTGLPVAYLGDDLTDEDAFAAMGNRGLSILVRGEVRRSCARFWLRPPEELLHFLDEWIAASQSQPAAATSSAEAPL
jgi:trehalose-phosphatase